MSSDKEMFDPEERSSSERHGRGQRHEDILRYAIGPFQIAISTAFGVEGLRGCDAAWRGFKNQSQIPLHHRHAFVCRTLALTATKESTRTNQS